MRAVVVYESLWGNTAAIARAIAEGIGPTAQALSTAEASVAAVADVDLIVAGAPVLGFRLPTDAMRQSVLTSERNAPLAPDLSHPSMRSWLETLPGARAGRLPSRRESGGRRVAPPGRSRTSWRRLDIRPSERRAVSS